MLSTRGVVTSVLVAMLALTARAQAPLPNATRHAERADNYYAAGNRIEITTPMAGDVIVAGREIDIAQPIAGDILAAGWRVTLTAKADDDVRIAGGEITINAPVTGDLTVAGQDVTLGAQTHVNGRTWLTGQTVRIAGVLDRDLHVAGAMVEIGGEIRQPVEIVADTLDILPSARILAPLTYKGPAEAHIAAGAVVDGPITYDRIPQREAQRARAFPTASTVLFTTHVFLAGLLVVLFLPRAENSVVVMLRAHPGKSFLTGFVAFVTVPVAAILLIISVLGLPLGLALGAVYAVGLFAAVVVTALCVGDLEARLLKSGPAISRGQHALLLLAGVLTLALLRSVFGGLIVVVSVLFGLGSLMLAAYYAYSREATPTAA